MIDEEATFEKFGYHSTDFKPQSHKKVVAVCDGCEKVRIIRKGDYRALCKSCSTKGERNPGFGKIGEKSPSFGKKGENNPRWTKVKRICQTCGAKFEVCLCRIKKGEGKFCNCKCHGKWLSKHQKGENHPNWQGGISFEPYCHKFNEEFKEYIRDKFERICFICSKTEAKNGRRLSVHHVNYNKKCGCDDDETCQFVPLCISCNVKANTNREEWEKKIKQKMQNKLNGWYI